MSLETQIAALVTAANNLTSSVNGKINQIDSSLSTGLATLEATVRSGFGSVSAYVHPVTGSDDTGDGSLAKPYKTIAKAVNSTLGSLTIFLAPGVHYNGGGVISVVGRSIVIKAYDSGTRENVIIKPQIVAGGSMLTSIFFSLRRSTLSLIGVTLDMSDVPDDSYWTRCFATLKGFSLLVLGDFTLEQGVTVKVGRRGNVVAGDPACVVYVDRDAGAVTVRNCSVSQVVAGAASITMHEVFRAEAGHGTLISAGSSLQLSGVTPFTYNVIGGVNYNYPA